MLKNFILTWNHGFTVNSQGRTA